MKKLLLISMIFLSANFALNAQINDIPKLSDMPEYIVNKEIIWQTYNQDKNNLTKPNESNSNSYFFKFTTTDAQMTSVKISLDIKIEFEIILYAYKEGKTLELKRKDISGMRGDISLLKTESPVSELICEIKFSQHYDGNINLCLHEEATTLNAAKSNLSAISYPFDATSLVENLFVMDGEIVDNVQFTGDDLSLGYFYNAMTEIGFAEGIILSTGKAEQCVGPNNSESNSSSMDEAGDSDLNQIIGSTTNDASILQFNFVPQSNVLHFEFVFASEEYPEFVNSSFNDVFAFLISGGPEEYVMQNFALIPETEIPVAINNVNGSAYSQYYIDNTDGHLNFQFDGLTTVFQVTVPVTAGSTYFIKMAVADVGDASYDSAIFLKKRSFGTTTTVTGSVYVDENSNCVLDAGEPAAANILVEALPQGFVTNTDENGHFSFPLFPGTYDISPILSPIWDVLCPEGGIQSVSVTVSDEIIENLDFGLRSTISCPILSVDVASGPIRPCFSSTYSISYSNFGSADANQAQITLSIDESLSIISATIPFTESEPNVYVFDIGNVEIFQSGSFNIEMELACDLDLVGQTKCVSAEINASNECDFINPGEPEFTEEGEYENTDWDHSSVSVDGICSEDTYAIFTITNTGDAVDGDMDGPSEYRLYMNDTIILIDMFQLSGGESLEITQETFGNSIRLEADQRPGHPGNSHPNAIVEDCGDYNGTSLGYINNFSQDDNDYNIDIYCREVTSSYDPNDKLVYPAGLTENHYFGDDAEFNYIINFQNTGTDTAFTVIIRDSIPQYLDMSTFRMGSSSHPCSLNINGNGILVWTFNNIQLPDSTTNLEDSKGFVSFCIKPDYDLPLEYGTLISNDAAIFFDYNLPVITNSVNLTYWNLREIILNVEEANSFSELISVYPNPATDEVRITLPEDKELYPVEIKIIDILGKTVFTKSVIDNSEQTIISEGKYHGLYFYEISNLKGLVKSGKLIFN